MRSRCSRRRGPTSCSSATIWTGAATLATPKDFRVFVKQIWGVGAF